MTRYLDVNAVSRLIQARGLARTIEEMAQYIVDDYCRWDQFAKSPRTAHYSPKGVIELMPISDHTHYAFKYVNGHPQNIEKNLPTVMALGVLAETETGLPLLLSEMTLTTAVRTAATSAAVAQKLARPDSKRMAVIGCGAQSEFQIIAFNAVLGIKEFCVFDVDPAAVKKLLSNLTEFNDIILTVALSVQDAVTKADIVTTVTADKSRAAVLTSAVIRPGMHINAVGGDCPGKTELDPDVLAMARVIVEYEPQTRIEGEIQQMSADFPVLELCQIFTGKAVGRRETNDITLFDSVGFALEDFSALRYLNDLATAQNAGVSIELVPSLADPKNLFSVLQPITLPASPKLRAMVNVENGKE